MQTFEKIMNATTQVHEIINSRWQANIQIIPLTGLSHLLPTTQFYSSL